MGNPNKSNYMKCSAYDIKLIRDRHPPSITVFMTGSAAALVSSVLMQPLDVLKTRLQSPDEAINGEKKVFRMIGFTRHIIEKEGIRVLWYGTIPTVLRGIPAGGLYFTIYDCLKENLWTNLSQIDYIILAMVSRAITDTALIPLTVVKTRMESGMSKYGDSDVFSALVHIYRTEGLAGLTSGLLPVLARDVPMSGTYIFFYNQSQTLFSKDITHNHEHLVHSTCAGIAGVLSSAVTHPPDVIKTKTQLRPDKFPTVWSTIVNIYAQDGIAGFFHGLLPRLMKRTVFAMISWTLYENVANNNKKNH